MIDYKQAQQLVLSQARSVGTERLSLRQAFGRVLAETIYADRDYPPFNRATMDGYALRTEDLNKGIREFKVVETIYAGSVSSLPLATGECYKIMTGAATPSVADIIIRREEVTVIAPEAGGGSIGSEADGTGGGSILLKDGNWSPYLNIARRGEDLKAGQVVVDQPLRCDPAITGLLATLGRAEVLVQRLPRIALVTTGNEVVGIDSPVGDVEIRNSNRWLLESALQKEGFLLSTAGHVRDEPLLLRAAIERGLDNDILILCGGVSAGDADYVPQVLEEAGVKKLFHKIAIKPGKPTWCGYHPGGCMVFALPGNPFSCLVNMVLLIRPYLLKVGGLPVPEPVGLVLGAARKKKTPLDEFFPVLLQGNPARLEPVSINSSGDIRLGRQANMLALHPAAAGDLPAGAEVLCYSFV